MPDLLETAVSYAGRGWPVLPLAGVQYRDNHLTCACWKHDLCISPGKHPRTMNGLFDASTDLAVVTDWFKTRTFNGWRPPNIGLRTGDAFDVLDVDEGGIESLAAWAKVPDEWQPGSDPEATAFYVWPGPIVRTGKGFHFYLQPQHTGNRAKMLRGLDYRGTGGYVVAPPSWHVDGPRYEWLREGPLVPAPDWLTAMLFPPTCDHVLRTGAICGKSGDHSHGKLQFVSALHIGGQE